MAESIKQALPNNNTYQNPIRICSRTAFGAMYPTIKAIPGTGATVTVQYTTSPWDDIVAGTATWDPWTPTGAVAGAVTVNTSDSSLGAIMAVKAKSNGGTATLEVCQ